jgi:hypothetical protein
VDAKSKSESPVEIDGLSHYFLVSTILLVAQDFATTVVDMLGKFDRRTFEISWFHPTRLARNPGHQRWGPNPSNKCWLVVYLPL